MVTAAADSILPFSILSSPESVFVPITSSPPEIVSLSLFKVLFLPVTVVLPPV